MTRTYALQRLLQHGSLTRSELIEVTGWDKRTVDKALWCTTVDRRVIAVPRRKGMVYSLPATHFMQRLA